MSFTLQSVQWALAHPCKVRIGDDWAAPEIARRQLSSLHSYMWSLKNGDILGEKRFTGLRVLDREISIPTRYELVEKSFEQYGGFSAVEGECFNCPANTELINGFKGFAGCGDSLPYLNRPIEESLDKYVLRTRFNDAFLQTKPSWFGLWASSPLTFEQCAILHPILTELIVTEKRYFIVEPVQKFLAALQISMKHKIALHVQMPPLGLFGVLTSTFIIFSHCARCKAMWNKESEKCLVCNHDIMIPSTHSEIISADTPKDNLLEELSAAEYEALIKEFLFAKGHNALEIDQVLQKLRDQNEKRKKNN